MPEIIPKIGPNQKPGRHATSIENNVIEPPIGSLVNLMLERTKASPIEAPQNANCLAVKIIFELSVDA